MNTHRLGVKAMRLMAPIIPGEELQVLEADDFQTKARKKLQIAVGFVTSSMRPTQCLDLLACCKPLEQMEAQFMAHATDSRIETAKHGRIPRTFVRELLSDGRKYLKDVHRTLDGMLSDDVLELF